MNSVGYCITMLQHYPIIIGRVIIVINFPEVIFVVKTLVRGLTGQNNN